MSRQFFSLTRRNVFRSNPLRHSRSFAVKVGKVIRQTEYASATDLNLLRNIGISAHIDSGKTTTTERILYYTGRIDAIHEVKGKDGVGAKMDSMELEREKGITIKSAATHTEWDGHHINIIDTPGHVDFTVEVERSLFVLDGAILLLCGSSGVQSQSFTVDKQMRRYNVPRVCFINKLDRVGADAFRVAEQARAELGINAVMMQIPIGLESEHKGVIDLITDKAYFFDGGDGEDVVEKEIPEELKAKATEMKWKMLEYIADIDDDIAMSFLEEEMPSVEELKAVIRKYTIAEKLVPVLMGASYKNIGVQLLLDSVIEYLPSPLDVENKAIQIDKEGNEKDILLKNDPLAPLIFQSFKLENSRYGELTWIKIFQGTLKTGQQINICGDNIKRKKLKVSKLCRLHSNEMQDIVEAKAGDIIAIVGLDCASGLTFSDGKMNVKVNPMYIPDPVVSMAVSPKDKGAVIKLSNALQRFQKEDPTFVVTANEESGEMIFNGMGELHLEVYLERLRREYKLDCKSSRPRVNYRERITNEIEYDHIHKKQTGGHGQYARVIGRIEPLPEDSKETFVYTVEVRGTNVPKEFFKSVGTGFKEFTEKGPMVGYPLINAKCVLVDGAFHEVDSSDLAFRMAAKGAFITNWAALGGVITEPYMNIEVDIPGEFENQVQESLLDRMCQIEDVERDNKKCVIRAYGPLDQMFGYITSLRSSTQGKGEFTMEYRDHAPVLPQKQDELIEEYRNRPKKE